MLAIRIRRSNRYRLTGFALFFAAISPAAAMNAAAEAASTAQVSTDDVTRFFRVYDAANGKPSVVQLQTQYIEAGSAGLRQFAALRIGSAERLAQKIAADPAMFEDARRCASALPEIRNRIGASLDKLAGLYPAASFPPVTVLIGRGTTGGVTTPAGVIIGLEMLCRADWLQADVSDRFVHLATHEYVHVQQPGAAVDTPDASLLYQALLEGGAELVGELISGQVANIHLHRWAQGRECAIEREFQADADATDLSRWLYNGRGDAERPGDLGYWAGYRVVSAYYAQAKDKTQAIADILDVTPENARQLLQASGWQPACPP